LTIRERLGAANSSTILLIGLIVAASGFISPPVALATGLVFSMLFTHTLRKEASALSKTLLQVSVVALGFGMNLAQVLKVGSSGFLYTAVSILSTLLLGTLLGKVLRVRGNASFLIAVGTAICGGSAIAAIAPVLEANEEEISVALGTVFALNSVALLLFPVIGFALHLSQDQFGLWAALAIHDTSSVVGASAKYGSQALIVGTTVKLARALWIIPVALATAGFVRRRATAAAEQHASRPSIKFPWFILYFCLASVACTYLGKFAHLYDHLVTLGKDGLTATLYLIGTSLSKGTLERVGFRPLLQGIILWLIVASIALAVIYKGFISV
jgi:uncharacterized integral membrane protein (TIGR00698 family)